MNIPIIRLSRKTALLLGSLLTCLLVCAVLTPKAAAAGFRDVPASHWAYESISHMSARGLIQGSGGNFHPNEPVSQQAFLSMVCRAAGLDDRNLQSGDNWADPAMAYAFYQGWCEEDEINRSSRAKPISRELAAKLLINALFHQELGRYAPPSFRDAGQISQDRRPYVETAAALDLLNGYDNDCFRPQSSLTRAAAAALLSRALARLEADHPAAGASLQVPVLMYHDISYLGQGYSKTPEIFERQMQELKDAGFHTVSYSQLVDYVERGTALPEKPIVISIDDGYRTNYTYAFPILKKLDMKAEISLIGAAIQYSSWGLKWDEIQEMAASGLVSFQCHTFFMHGDYTAEGGRLGVLKAKNESWQAYTEALGADTVKALDMLETKTGTRPIAYTYPMGKWNQLAEAMVSSLDCKVTVTTKDGVAEVRQGDPSSLHLMDRIGMDFLNGSVLKVLRRYGYQG